jgi:hypothetical protein
VTQTVGPFAWTLTNSYVVGRDSSATAAVTHASGTLRVTNSQSTARLIVGQFGRGTFNLGGGEVVADTLLATNGPGSIINFTSGALRTRNATVATFATQFAVGDGLSTATFELLANGTNSFPNGLNIASQGVVAGNGTLSGALTVQAGGQLSPGAGSGASALGRIVAINSPLLQGATLMEIGGSGAITSATNDQLQVFGPLTYGGTLTVTNIGTNALMAGDRFQLFSASSFAGLFTSINLPPLGPGLTWKTNLLVDGSLEVFAPPAIPLSSGSYTQNFASLAGSSSSFWRDNSTLLGWYAAETEPPTDITSYLISDGSLPNGALYSFGSTGNGERALGSIGSGSVGNISYGLCFSNDTANSVSSFIITYTGEQWRCGGSGSVTNTLSFWYRVSASAITNPEPGVVTNWTEVTNLDFLSPTVLATATALDGNQTSNRHAFAAVIVPGLTLPPGQHVFFRWRDLNDAGADQGIALDDLTVDFSVQAPPQITSVGLTTNHFVQITGQTESNSLFVIEAATNLGPPIFWQPLVTNTADGAGQFQFTDTNAPTFSQRFYRAWIQ